MSAVCQCQHCDELATHRVRTVYLTGDGRRTTEKISACLVHVGEIARWDGYEVFACWPINSTGPLGALAGAVTAEAAALS